MHKEYELTAQKRAKFIQEQNERINESSLETSFDEDNKQKLDPRKLKHSTRYLVMLAIMCGLSSSNLGAALASTG